MTAQIPSMDQLVKELEKLCQIGYLEGRAQSLEQVPGLIGLVIVGGPKRPDAQIEWHERREDLRGRLREIVVTEVAEELGEKYEAAALRLFRLDDEPLPRERHTDLTEIQEDLNESFGVTRTARGFLLNYRPLLLDVIARSLIAREKDARGQADEPNTSSPPGTNWGRYGLLVGGVALVVVVLVIVGVLTRGGSEDVPIAEQIADDIPEQGVVRTIRKVHLRDAATLSYFVVVRRPPSNPHRDETQSWDELRIYDDEGSDAELRFLAQPVSLIGGAPTVMREGFPWGNTTGRMYRFQLLGVHDTNGDGRTEIFGTFSDQISDAKRPLAIGWNSSADQYELVPLVREPPKAPVYDPGDPGVSLAHWAHRESRIGLNVDVSPKDGYVKLYGATEVAVRRVPNLGWILISGHAATSGTASVSRQASGSGPAVPNGLNLSTKVVYERKAVINLMTVKVAQLQYADGLVQPEPCDVLATSRLRLERPSGRGTPYHPPPPPLISFRSIPMLTTNALASDPLAPQRLDLYEHVVCPT